MKTSGFGNKVLFLAAGLACVLVVIALSGEDSTVMTRLATVTVSEQDREAMQETIAGAYDALATLGAFPSEDGTTANLSQAELDGLIKQYQEKVKTYYARQSTQYKDYPEMNRAYLEEIFQAPEEIYDCLDGGVLRCDINKVRMDESGDRATVDSYVVKWSLSVSQWQEPCGDASVSPTYVVTPSVGRYHVTNRLIREDGAWKVLETETYELVESGYNDELRDRVLKAYDVDKTLTMTTEEGHVCKISDAEADTILSALARSDGGETAATVSALRKNLAAYDTVYATAEQAIQAAKALDVPKGNYFALDAALQDLSTETAEKE